VIDLAGGRGPIHRPSSRSGGLDPGVAAAAPDPLLRTMANRSLGGRRVNPRASACPMAAHPASVSRDRNLQACAQALRLGGLHGSSQEIHRAASPLLHSLSIPSSQQSSREVMREDNSQPDPARMRSGFVIGLDEAATAFLIALVQRHERSNRRAKSLGGRRLRERGHVGAPQVAGLHELGFKGVRSRGTAIQPP